MKKIEKLSDNLDNKRTMLFESIYDQISDDINHILHRKVLNELHGQVSNQVYYKMKFQLCDQLYKQSKNTL
jgi:hypothetical protein